MDHLTSDVERWHANDDLSDFAATDLRSYLHTFTQRLETVAEVARRLPGG